MRCLHSSHANVILTLILFPPDIFLDSLCSNDLILPSFRDCLIKLSPSVRAHKKNLPTEVESVYHFIYSLSMLFIKKGLPFGLNISFFLFLQTQPPKIRGYMQNSAMPNASKADYGASPQSALLYPISLKAAFSYIFVSISVLS